MGKIFVFELLICATYKTITLMLPKIKFTFSTSLLLCTWYELLKKKRRGAFINGKDLRCCSRTSTTLGFGNSLNT